MIMNVDIKNNKYLYRTIQNIENKIETLLACVFLISSELKSAEKIQFSLVSKTGSIHFEYKNETISYYTRKEFIYESSHAMSVSIIYAIGNAYTSRVSGENAVDCFVQYLLLSDQREAFFEFSEDSVVKIEKLPPTKHIERSVYLESVEIDTVNVTSFQ